MHTDRDIKGRYRQTALCDACNRPIGLDHVTDDEVCADGDGAGFYLCSRVRCETKRDRLDVEARRALYAAARAARA